MSQVAEFLPLLRGLAAADAPTRTAAERAFFEAHNNPEALICSLLAVISQEPDFSHFAAVLLRRLVGKTTSSLFHRLPTTTQQLVKHQLLQLLGTTPAGPCRTALAHCIDGLASIQLEEGQWPELIPHLCGLASSGKFAAEKCALQVLSLLTGWLGETSAVALSSQWLPLLAKVLSRSGCPLDVLEVQVTALQAVCGLVRASPDSAAPFSEAVPRLLQVVRCCASDHPELASTALEAIIQLIDDVPEFVETHTAGMLGAVLDIASSNLSERPRHLAVECFLALCDANPKVAKRNSGTIETLLPLLFNMLLTVEHADDWGSREDDSDEDFVDFDVALQACDRLALSVGAAILPATANLIGQHLQQPGWKGKFVALMVASQIAEGCAAALRKSPQLPFLVGVMAQNMRDSHPRVRYAAVHCTAQFCSYLGPDFQKGCGPQLAAPLVDLLADSVSRVAAHAALSWVNYLEDLDESCVAPLVDPLTGQLLATLSSSTVPFFHANALSALTALLQAAPKASLFPHYASVMQYVSHALTAPLPSPMWRLARGRAMLCAAYLGSAVGKERFSSDAAILLRTVLPAIQEQLTDDDPQTNYIHRTRARIAAVIGEDFAAYLPSVLPPLLNTISAERGVEVQSGNADEAPDEPEDGTELVVVSRKGHEDQVICLHTAVLEERAAACVTLLTYLSDLGPLLAPHAVEILSVVGPLCRFPYSLRIRETCTRIVAGLCAVISPHREDPAVKSFTLGACSTLLEAAKCESVGRIREAQLVCLAKCIQLVPELPDRGQQEALTQQAFSVFQEIFEESIKGKSNSAEEEEEEVERDEDDEEDECCDLGIAEAALDCFHATLRLCPDAAPPLYVASIIPTIPGLVSSDNVAHKRLGLIALTGFMESGAEAALQYLGETWKALQLSLTSRSAEVFAEAARGVAIITKVFSAHPSTVQQLANASAWVPLLMSAVRPAVGSRVHQQTVAANAAWAILELNRAFGSRERCVSDDVTLPKVLAALPLGGAKQASEAVYGRIVQLVQQGSPTVQQYPKLSSLLQYLRENPDRVSAATLSILQQVG
eukprot:TRINITY_DN8735_c0_g1_i1.p1 TRINITY_DN8735_c0_g1~~TRINITY_DN8735_c0_g1_i1.p1  ORF type:complete len:1062 (+),score=149.34 TRINITY_DN8735_c0_g1_i1:26-3211(+)